VAERNSAVHTPAGLQLDLAVALLGVDIGVYLAPIVDALGDRTLGCISFANIEKAMRISHALPP
jgi:hypothetical protein